MPFYRFLPLAALAARLCVSPVSAADPKDCAAEAKKVSDAVSARLERVLIIVEDTLVADDQCACEVVKAAIVAAKAGPKLVGQIVLTAVSASPKRATAIAECATATSPDAAGEIKAALKKALGTDAVTTPPAAPATAPAPPASGDGKNPASAKNPPPAPPPAAAEADFGLSPVAIGGVYLVYPSSGASRVQVRRDSHGNIVLIGPDGRRLVVNPEKPTTGGRQPRPPDIIIIRPPTQTASEESPAP